MIFSVPQYIDVEDKIAGPLTARQLGWMFALGALLFLAWSLFEQAIFIAIAIPTILFFLALAFYRPQGISFLSFLSYGVGFLFRPKLYMWKRLHEPTNSTSKSQKYVKGDTLDSTPKVMSIQDMVELAQTLDSEGRHQSDRAAQIIAERAPKKKK